MAEDNIAIVYVAGNGRSGSTLLSMVLDSDENAFNAGELAITLFEKDFEQQYCTCGSLIRDCIIWQDILDRLRKKLPQQLNYYKRLRDQFESPRLFILILLNIYFPTIAFKEYIYFNRLLFETIVEVTGSKTIIDSSKNPGRIIVLNAVVDKLFVVHFCRDFSGVLNSRKKIIKKDLSKGVQRDFVEKISLMEALTRWVFTNLLVEIFVLGKKSIRLSYEKFIENPEIVIRKIRYLNGIKIKDTFSSMHMIGGNRVRMKKNVTIDKNQASKGLGNLSKTEKYIAKGVDFVFSIWR